MDQQWLQKVRKNLDATRNRHTFRIEGVMLDTLAGNLGGNSGEREGRDIIEALAWIFKT